MATEFDVLKKTATQFSSPLAPPPSFLDLDPIVPSKPVINWTQLSGPVESAVHKISRRAGKSLVIMSVISGAGRYLAATRMTASPDMIINTCFALRIVTIVSAVGGIVFWFFNRLDVNPTQLLKQRANVEKEIEAASFKQTTKTETQIEAASFIKLRGKYPSPFVISNEELNQWIRYSAQKNSFKEFMEVQTDRIFDLPLEEKTKEILKEKYIAYIQDPTTEINVKTLVNERAFKFLLSNGTKEHELALKKLIVNRAALSLQEITPVSYQQFIQDHGTESLQYLTEWNLERLFPGFSVDIKESKVGVLQLKREHATELKAFGEVITQPLFQDIANREGVQSYIIFEDRNGAEAISFINMKSVKDFLCVSFSNHVVDRNLGLINTKTTFGDVMERFGDAAVKSINSRVLAYEMNALETDSLTYLQFRERNGIEAIIFQSIGDPTKLQKHFLRLSYVDLIHADYKNDRDIMVITDPIIKNTLWVRWNAMSIKDVLATDKEGFLASIGRFFSPRDWTPKAVAETQNLTIKDVITLYADLFAAQVLTASDGNFVGRLAEKIKPITKWTTLIDTYGSFVFKQGLLEFSQVKDLIHRFVDTNANSYLHNSFDKGIANYVQIINEFCLSMSLDQKIKTAQVTVVAEKTRYKDWLTVHEAEYKAIIKGCEDQAKKDIISVETSIDLPRREREKNATYQAWLKRNAAHNALVEGIPVYQQSIDASAATIADKRISMKSLEDRQQQLIALKVTSYYSANEALAQQAKAALQNAEVAVQTQAGPLKRQGEAELKKLELEEKELNEKIQKIEGLQQEINAIQKIVQKAYKELEGKVALSNLAETKKTLQEKIDHLKKPVTGLPAAEQAKKDRAEAEKQLKTIETIEKNEKRCAELQTLIDQDPIDPLKTRHKQLLSLIQQQQRYVNNIVSNVETQKELTQLRANESQASQVASKWRNLDLELQTLPTAIQLLRATIQQLTSDREQKIGARDEQESLIPDSAAQLVLTKTKKALAETAYNSASTDLASRTLEIHQKCSASIEQHRLVKERLLEEAIATNAQALQQIVTTFRQQIYVA